jgi:hypothetical protein
VELVTAAAVGTASDAAGTAGAADAPVLAIAPGEGLMSTISTAAVVAALLCAW